MYKKKRSSAAVKVGFGAKSGTFIPMLVGYAFGFAGDMAYSSLGFPGYDQKIGNCNAFSFGDIIQVAGLTGITFLSFLIRNWTFASFAFGAAAGSITPKLLAAQGLPRYLVFDINSKTGTIAPLGGGVRGAYEPLNNAAKAVGDTVGKIVPQKSNYVGYY